MFSTVSDTINSMLGITILIIASTSIICYLINSVILQKIIQWLGLALWFSFWIGRIFFNNILETVFNIAVFIFLAMALVCGFIWFVRQIISEMPPRMSREEIEFQCHHCMLYEECLSLSACYEPYCSEFEPTDDFI